MKIKITIDLSSLLFLLILIAIAGDSVCAFKIFSEQKRWIPPGTGNNSWKFAKFYCMDVNTFCVVA